MDNFICGGYIFQSNFDSGNLHKVELVKWNEGTSKFQFSQQLRRRMRPRVTLIVKVPVNDIVCFHFFAEILPTNNTVGVEFNLWTKPDCAGTEYENLNRSWFFFSIQGKFLIDSDTKSDESSFRLECRRPTEYNMQIQRREFEQTGKIVQPRHASGDSRGRHGEMGTHQRQSNLRCESSACEWSESECSSILFSILQLVDGDFVLTFFHKPQENANVKHYYAFTFPFTYSECQNQLAGFDCLHQKSVMELNYILRRLNSADQNANTDEAATNQIGDGKWLHLFLHEESN